MNEKLVKVVCTVSGDLKEGKSFPALLLYDKRLQRRRVIGQSPVEVTMKQYKLMKSKHGDKVALFNPSRHKVPEIRAEHIKSITMTPAKVKRKVKKTFVDKVKKKLRRKK